MKFLHPVIGAVALSLCVWAGAQPVEVLQAARRGEADAQFRLGVLFDKGRGVVQDDEQALQWFRRAAQQGRGQCQAPEKRPHGSPHATKTSGEDV